MSRYAAIPSAAIVTFSGKVIEPLNPDPAQIDIEDIAHSLSNQCRFTGHTKHFYSVAQHSVLVSHECDHKDALWGLLHDASEAYLSDIARPIKRYTAWGSGYGDVERKLEIAVAFSFGLQDNDTPYEELGVMPASVKRADDLLLRTEMRDLMPPGVSDTIPGEMLGEELAYWTPKFAKMAFLQRYDELK